MTTIRNELIKTFVSLTETSRPYVINAVINCPKIAPRKLLSLFDLTFLVIFVKCTCFTVQLLYREKTSYMYHPRYEIWKKNHCTCHHMLHCTTLITKPKIIYRPATFFHPPLRDTVAISHQIWYKRCVNQLAHHNTKLHNKGTPELNERAVWADTFGPLSVSP